MQKERNGVLHLSRTEFRDFFDTQARNTVNLSGEAALKRIKAGRTDSGLAWTELVLLAALFPDE